MIQRHCRCTVASFTLIVVTFSPKLQGQAGVLGTNEERLAHDQVAIYRAVITEYLGGGSAGLNIQHTTELPDQDHPFFDDSCPKSIQPKIPSPLRVHSLDQVVEGHPKWVLVDRDKQNQMVKENNPQQLVQRAVDDHEKVTHKELNESVETAFKTGLFTLSEIVFDKLHQRAAVAYSFVCGELCGNGDTLILRKQGTKWKVVKRCGGWVS